MTGKIEFTVYGIPQTKGSTKAFFRKGMRFPVITNDNTKNKPWAQTVSAMAQQFRPEALWLGPVRVKLLFRMPIPKSLPKRRPSFMTKKPDLDKMVRSIKDALKGVIYKDDSQVVGLVSDKVYHEQPGVIITLEQIDFNYEGAVRYAYRPYDAVAVNE
jgi:Holliday junction resolvase RusA-like endonuclease